MTISWRRDIASSSDILPFACSCIKFKQGAHGNRIQAVVSTWISDIPCIRKSTNDKDITIRSKGCGMINTRKWWVGNVWIIVTPYLCTLKASMTNHHG